MMQNEKPKKTPRTFTTLVVLIIFFAIPIIIAAWLFQQHKILGGKTTNHGEFILPPLAVTELKPLNPEQQAPAPNGKWTLAMLTNGHCDNACKTLLFYLHQIQKASGKNQQRVAHWIISTEDSPTFEHWLNQTYPTMIFLTINKNAYHKLVNTHTHLKFLTAARTVFIIDPHGNIIMAYPPGIKPMDIFKDLQQLLKVSQIG